MPLLSPLRVVPSVAGLIVVLVLFCAPLFIGLGGWDLRSDEAIYAYAVDRIVDTGEWLTPRSIQVDGPFLEKPPLKFWMVAALMRSGLASQDEAGYRTLDAVMGAIAFIYIYLFGLRLGGAVCGVIAVLVTFSMDSIVYEHGLRSTNMEAPLFLAYCAGTYHFMRWVDGAHRRVNALAAAGSFVLGFMTKFVAAIFLPAIWVLAVVAIGAARRQFIARWRDWLVPVGAATAAIVPWFWYETQVYGDYFWSVILGMHVYTRFTGALDPGHLEPWHFYITRMWAEWLHSGGRFGIAAGVVAAVIGAWRGPWALRLVIIWWIVPLASISLGTSKLYHYAYPFLPPIGLLVGWAAGELLRASDRWAMALTAHYQSFRVTRAARFMSMLERARPLLLLLATAAIALAIATAISGRVEWRIGGIKLLQNSLIARPLLVAALLFSLSGRTHLSVKTIVALAIALALPVSTYEGRVRRAGSIDHRLRVVRECATRVREAHPDAASGVFDAAPHARNHSHYYYLRGLGAWSERTADQPSDVQARLYDPRQQTIVLMTTEEYGDWRRLAAERSVPLPPAAVVDGVAIVTPGAYSACASAAVVAGAERPTVY